MRLINTEIRVENSSVCNARCTICPRDKFKRDLVIMPVSHFTDLVFQAKEIGAETISIFGYGEPLCDRKIVERVGIVSSLGLESFITTNASRLGTDLASRLVDNGLSHIRFSVHGLWDNYEKVHRGLKFSRVTRNIFNFIKIQRGRTKVSVSVIPMHGESVEEIREFWEDKVDYLEIWKPHNWTDGRKYRGVTKKKKKSCGRPFNGPVQIQADGKMVVCCFDYNGVLEMGDTYLNTIDEILKGDEYNAIREKHSKGDLSGLICDSCDQLNMGNTNPLLYSNRDPERNTGTTSSCKIKLEEKVK